jgi:hypothetical protein
MNPFEYFVKSFKDPVKLARVMNMILCGSIIAMALGFLVLAPLSLLSNEPLRSILLGSYFYDLSISGVLFLTFVGAAVTKAYSSELLEPTAPKKDDHVREPIQKTEATLSDDHSDDTSLGKIQTCNDNTNR